MKDMETLRAEQPELVGMLETLKKELNEREEAIQRELVGYPRAEKNARYLRFQMATRPLRESIGSVLGHLAVARISKDPTITISRTPPEGDTSPSIVINGENYWLA